MQLPDAFVERMRNQLSDTEFNRYLAALDDHRPRSLRVNTLKISVDDFLTVCNARLVTNGIIPEGFFIPDGFPVGTNPLHAAGLFYMQEPSAQFPAALLHPNSGETVLDLCAAPGGKTGQLAQHMNNTGLLIANEPVSSRASVLNGTKERLGLRNTVISSLLPNSLCPKLHESVDKLLIDAPCSGEGMFRKEPDAIRDWSPEHVTSCAERQRAILDSGAEALKPGGSMVYSTCTFSEEEDEYTIECFLKKHPEFTLVEEHKLYPHNSSGEGQYAALLKKMDSSHPGPFTSKKTIPPQHDRKAMEIVRSCLKSIFTSIPDGDIRILPDGRVFLLESPIPSSLENIRLISTGVFLGELKKDRLEPSHALFMAFPAKYFLESFTPNADDLMRFLRGETIPCNRSLAGYLPVLTNNYTIGFGKASGGVIKNHIPKGLRFY